MSKDTYLRIPDLDGRVMSKDFKGWVKIESFSLATPSGYQPQGSNIGSAGGGSQRQGYDRVLVLKFVDATSPILADWVATGHFLDEAVVFFEGRSPGSAMAILYLQEVHVTDMHVGGTGGGGDTPVESVALEFQKMQFMPLAQYLGLKGVQALAGLLSWFR
jgi:type VI protein secretion system component Hcp